LQKEKERWTGKHNDPGRGRREGKDRINGSVFMGQILRWGGNFGHHQWKDFDGRQIGRQAGEKELAPPVRI